MGKLKPEKLKHNLGGVNMHRETWLKIKARFEKQCRADESFSAWVRRTLVGP